MKKNREKILNIACPILSVAAILLLWSAAALAADSEYILPTVGQTLSAAFSLFKSGEFYAAVGRTFLRAVIAFVCSFFAAFVLAFFSYKKTTFRKIVAPFIKVIRALPTVAVVLLLLFWTSSEIAPVIVTMLVVLPALYTELFNAFCGIDREVIEMCSVFGVPKKVVLFSVEIPQILPSALYSAGAGLSLNLKLMVAAEVIAQTAVSLGYLLNKSKVYFEIADMLAIVAFAVITGAAIESAFGAIAKKAGKRL